jgi:hypothetical protein
MMNHPRRRIVMIKWAKRIFGLNFLAYWINRRETASAELKGNQHFNWIALLCFCIIFIYPIICEIIGVEVCIEKLDWFKMCINLSDTQKIMPFTQQKYVLFSKKISTYSN